MKIFVAQATAGRLAGLDGYRAALDGLLEADGHKVQPVDLSPIAAGDRLLTNIASFRLLTTAANADVLICLDAVSAVLRHPRKLILLLDDAHLVADPNEPAGQMTQSRYIANLLRAGLKEAKGLFTVSRFGHQRLRKLSIAATQLPSLELPIPRAPYVRSAGPELLVLNRLDDRQRPELLIDCLAALPEPFRARWIAPDASAANLARARGLAEIAGVERRVVFEARAIDGQERAYLLANAAAVLELAANVLAVPDTVYQAHTIGVPVIACADGGALIEVVDPTSWRAAKPDGAALAEAVQAVCAPSALETREAVPVAKAGTGNWAALMKAVAK